MAATLEVADIVEELAGRPTAVERCRDAIGRFLKAPSEAHRELLRAACPGIPPHRRVHSLGGMDHPDCPVRILLTELGEPVDGDGPVATDALHQWALDCFARGEGGVARERGRHADDAVTAGRPVVALHRRYFRDGRPAELDLAALRNDFPVPVRYGGDTCPSVLHGCWALSTAEEADRVAVREAPTADEAQGRGGWAVRRDGWTDVRLAVMAGLLRAKPYWRDAGGDRGRNRAGRLLELVRAELLAERISWPTGE
ncbi:DUF1768 domain-containing protein [Streptomyces sp. NBC_01275]|uniref:DUF7639 domain-containing protein n=1 Tax=Streptomyces sp. NBC_01275 TaxID=2903807 RepID=UPI00225C1868|nr:DUF1768 domain-containing protein [Streptomyces sp. NBC_01275]MCX4760903.1 DUF1768 domain-containing protein [Streptomyces sp. NBC_01275]